MVRFWETKFLLTVSLWTRIILSFDDLFVSCTVSNPCLNLMFSIPCSHLTNISFSVSNMLQRLRKRPAYCTVCAGWLCNLQKRKCVAENILWFYLTCWAFFLHIFTMASHFLRLGAPALRSKDVSSIICI